MMVLKIILSTIGQCCRVQCSNCPSHFSFLQHNHVPHESERGALFLNAHNCRNHCTSDCICHNYCALNTQFLGLLSDCVQEFVSYYGKNTTAPELAAKILNAVDEFKKA